MLITVGCPACGHRYDIAGRLAGKKVRCKQCASVFRVPVPVTMPAEPEKPAKVRRKRRRKGAEALLSELTEGATADLSATSEPTPYTAGPLLPDLGDRLVYRLAPMLVPALMWVLARLGAIGSFRATVLVCLIVGACLLLPVLADWPSFERSRRARLLSWAIRLDGARAVQATVAIALWVFALLLTMGTIRIDALNGPPRGEPTSRLRPGLEPGGTPPYTERVCKIAPGARPA